MNHSVKLVAITEGAEELVGRSAQELISYVARVSSPGNQENFATAPKLIRYLLDSKHWSPFEHVSCTMEITTSRAIAAQILRHRSFVYSEFSQRYSAVQNFVAYEARRQDSKNRQNSIDDMGDADKEFFSHAQDTVWQTSKGLYDEALSRGIAKEQARFLLPLNTETKLYMTGSIRSWIHYAELRCGNGTQKEHMEIALAARAILATRFPDIAAAMGWV
jgi:thymidylate synthase (FAD)